MLTDVVQECDVCVWRVTSEKFMDQYYKCGEPVPVDAWHMLPVCEKDPSQYWLAQRHEIRTEPGAGLVTCPICKDSWEYVELKIDEQMEE